MASNEIKLTQSLDDRQYIEALNRHFKMLDKLEQKMAGLSKESKKANDSLQDMSFHGQKSFMDYSKVTTGIAAGFAAIVAGLKDMIAAEEEAMKKAAGIGKEYDNLQRSFRVLSGLRGLEAGAAQKSIEDIALKESFTKEQAYGGAKGLVSAGFSPSEASGGALKELLYGMAAAGEIEGNPEEYAPIVAGYLANTGKEKNAANIRDVMRRITALGSTNFTLKNGLGALSSEAGSLKELTSEEQFAGMAVLQEGVPGTTASTVMRNAVSALTSQRNNKMAMKALKGMGIEPESVDLVGEDFSTAMKRMAFGYRNASPEMRNSYLSTFAGKENRAAFTAVMDNILKFDELVDKQKGLGIEGEFRDAHDEATTGPNAMRRRADLRLGQLRRDRNEKIDLEEQLIEIQGLEQGKSEWGIGLGKQIYRTGKAVTGIMGKGSGDESPREIRDIAQELAGNTAALKENNDLMRQQNGQGAAAAPPTRQVQRTN